MKNNIPPMIPVVLSGGAGTRLWPLSRSLFPKQFIPLFGKCLFERTLERLAGLEIAHTIVMCSDSCRFFATDSIRRSQVSDSTLILEPVMRNTAPAITLSALAALDIADNSVLLVLPSDHLVEDVPAFESAVAKALPVVVDGALVTFGIVPKYPETGYGYICRGEEKFSGIYQVSEFHEKPDKATAEKWFSQGNYYWNSGMFLFTARAYLDGIAKYAPDILEACEKAYAKRTDDFGFTCIDEESFGRSANISIDYALMEKADNVFVIPSDFGWNDVGSWESLSTLFEHDSQGNAHEGDVIFHTANDNIVYSEGRLIAVLGIDDCVIADTRDATLVAKRSQLQNVKQLVKEMKADSRVQVNEHRKVFRPWGSYESIDADDGFQAKRIVVNPGQQLSLQLHHHRAEHWVVVKGTAHVTRGEDEIVLQKNESTYIPIGVKHRLENRGTEPLFLIEVQCGDYLGEDDIVRFEDTYGRAGK